MSERSAQGMTRRVACLLAFAFAAGCDQNGAATSKREMKATLVEGPAAKTASPTWDEVLPGTVLLEGRKSEKDPKSAQDVLARGQILEESGRFEEALQLYEQALSEPHAPLGVLSQKALVQSWLKRFTESRVSYRALLDDPRADAAHRRHARRKLAELDSWEGKLDEARSELLSLLKGDPSDVETSLLYGQILEWQGRYPEAKRAYAKILEDAPEHEEARRRLDKLIWVP